MSINPKKKPLSPLTRKPLVYCVRIFTKSFIFLSLSSSICLMLGTATKKKAFNTFTHFLFPINSPPPPATSHTHSSSDVLWELSTEYQSMSDPAVVVHFLIEITILYDREMNATFGRENCIYTTWYFYLPYTYAFYAFRIAILDI